VTITGVKILFKPKKNKNWDIIKSEIKRMYLEKPNPAVNTETQGGDWEQGEINRLDLVIWKMK
jgi:hypothetical protein